MKVGDLVFCNFQPKSNGYIKGVGCLPMKHHIQGELGIIIEEHESRFCVMFPRFGYTHIIARNALEVISEAG